MMHSATERKGLLVWESDTRLNGERRLRDSSQNGTQADLGEF